MGEERQVRKSKGKLALQILSGVIAAIVGVLVLMWLETLLSEAIDPIDMNTWEGTFVLAAPFVPFLLLAVVVVWVVWRARRPEFGLGLLGGGALVFVFLAVMFIRDPLGLGGGGDCEPKDNASCSLDYALHPNLDEQENFTPETTFTADYMNRHRRGKEREITYVPGDISSTAPNIVSVHPIDEYTWGAAAKSRESGKCYLVMAITDRSNPRFGTTRYGELSKRSPCLGSKVSLASTKDVTELYDD